MRHTKTEQRKKLPEVQSPLLKRIYRQRYVYLMLIPGVIWALLFSYAPMVGLYMAFVDYHPTLGKFWSSLFSSEFVGLQWFQYFFSGQDFFQVMRNTLISSALTLSIGFVVPILIAIAVNEARVYYNEVIKPALVGLAGPWISGGIEFNWPQHHRPTTFSPVDYVLSEQEDGSKTVRVSEVDQMNGTKGMASFTLYPDRAYIEIRGQLYNRTPLPQTFLWWANPAVAVNAQTQSIFPPDVTAVMDHGKRDVSKFPIATGVYYKHDYSAGVDISRYPA